MWFCVFLEQESQLEDERGKNEQLKEEADLLRRKAQLLDQVGDAARDIYRFYFVYKNLFFGHHH